MPILLRLVLSTTHAGLLVLFTYTLLHAANILLLASCLQLICPAEEIEDNKGKKPLGSLLQRRELRELMTVEELDDNAIPCLLKALSLGKNKKSFKKSLERTRPLNQVSLRDGGCSSASGSKSKCLAKK